jgi:hypothetical protein
MACYDEFENSNSSKLEYKTGKNYGGFCTTIGMGVKQPLQSGKHREFKRQRRNKLRMQSSVGPYQGTESNSEQWKFTLPIWSQVSTHATTTSTAEIAVQPSNNMAAYLPLL